MVKLFLILLLQLWCGVSIEPNLDQHALIDASVTTPTPASVTTPTPAGTIGTTTIITFNPTNPYYGNSIAIDAVVTTASGAVRPTGNVVFKNVATVIGTVAVKNNLARLIIAGGTWSAGTYPITATYEPNAVTWSGSIGIGTVAVKPARTITTLSSNSSAPILRTPFNLIAQVSWSAATPTGTVTFTNGTTVIGSATLSNGIASLPVSGWPVGTYTITGIYVPDRNNFLTSNSTFTVVVAKGASTTTLTASPTAQVLQAQQLPIKFTVKVTSSSGTPTGTVTLTKDVVVETWGPTALVNGVATFSVTSFWDVGNYDFQAFYQPATTNWAASQSKTVTVTLVVGTNPPAASNTLAGIPTFTPLGATGTNF